MDWIGSLCTLSRFDQVYYEGQIVAGEWVVRDF